MRWFRIGFLLFIACTASGYRFRCYAFCTDQTAVQHDYIEERDRCRRYAELKVDMGVGGREGGAKGKQARLVTLFNECMANNGWNIVADKPAAPPAANAGPTTAAAAALTAAAPVDPQQEKASISRSAECMFARHSAGQSAIAASRAKACDLECSQRLAAAPDAPRPAACPADVTPDPEMTRGHETEAEPTN